MKKFIMVAVIALVGISFSGCAMFSKCGCGGKKCAEQGAAAKCAKCAMAKDQCKCAK